MRTMEGEPVHVGDELTGPVITPDGETPPPRRQPDPPPPPAGPAVKRTRGPNKPKPEQPRTAPRAATLDDKARAAGVKGIAQLGAGLTLLAGKATGNDALRADAVTVASSADDLADACVQTAKADAKFAAALDRVCAVGPYGALITVAVGVGSQVVRNHRPGVKIAGTKDPAELLKAQDELEAKAADGASGA
jgi:hypothetical protein